MNCVRSIRVPSFVLWVAIGVAAAQCASPGEQQSGGPDQAGGEAGGGEHGAGQGGDDPGREEEMAGGEAGGGAAGGGAGTSIGGGGEAGAGGTSEAGSGGTASGGAAGSLSGGTGGSIAGGAGGSASAGTGGSPAGRVPTFVVVGYGGVRVRSIDGGRTWIDAQRLGGGGDDQFLLRAVAHGAGLFVAVGWQIHTSPDGKTWTQRTNPRAQWFGGIKYGSGRFVAGGGWDCSAYSLDGINWMNGGMRRVDPMRSVAYGEGVWMAKADSGSWWRTTDGRAWTEMPNSPAGAVVYCGDRFTGAGQCNLPIARNNGRTAFGDGVYVSVTQKKVQRSTDGTTWTDVYTASDNLEGVAFGYAGQ